MNKENSTLTTLPLQVHAMFEQVKLKRVGAMVVVFDMIVAGVLFEIVPFHTARWVHVSVLFLAICYAAWICNSDRKYCIRYRDGVVERLTPGWYRVGIDGWVKRWFLDDGIQASGECEMISLSDQGGMVSRVAGGADVVFYVLMFVIFLPILNTTGVFYVDAHLAIWALFLVIFLKWAIWGNAFFSGMNRLRVDPDGWQWGGWSNRFKKSGRWADTRVFLKPMTRWRRDRHFVVMGTEDGTVGMIVPEASVELIKRAYASHQPLTTPPDDSHPSPAS